MEKQARWIGPTHGVAYAILKCADDVTYALAHGHEPILGPAAWEESAAAIEVVEDLGLSSAGEKSENLRISPDGTVGDLRRRCPSAAR